jgi:uncharacterized membrane protein YdjX (TVP38/TMEM64 family)
MTDPDDHNGRPAGMLWILPLAVIAGLALAVWQPVGLDELLTRGERIGRSPLFLTVVVALIVVMFTLGMPGSLGLWLIAPFNPPLIATVLLVVASTSGALGAYFLAGHLHRDWRPSGMSGRVVKILERHGDMLTQTAIRVLPGFPHSVINFAGGVLRLPLAGFITAAIVGLSIKWAIYASAVHGITDAVAAGSVLRLDTLAPLFILAVMVLAGAWFRRRLGGGR